MDRSLKWRTIALLLGCLLFVGILMPSFMSRDQLPSWFPFEKKINLGLDLQGGLHIVYSIDLDKAIDDKASEIKRDLEARFSDEKTAAVVRTPSSPLGAVYVSLTDQAKREAALSAITADYGGETVMMDCPAAEPPGSICFRVSSDYADGIKRAALTNAVATIRERIDEKGIAEPTVVEKGDEILVELPGIDKESIQETRDIIARTAKLEFKVVDENSEYMKRLYAHVGSEGKENRPTDPAAIAAEIRAEIDQWRPEDGGGMRTDYFLMAHDREQLLTPEEAKAIGCLNKGNKDKLENGRIKCNVTGRRVLDLYLFGDDKLGIKGLADTDPAFKLPDDRQISYEYNEPAPEAKDKRPYWRSYYLDRAVRLTGSGISDAMGSYDPNTNRPIVLLDFNRYGSRVFGDLTAQIVGKKLATILDDKVKSAPIINGAIRGGRASITMGGSEATRMEAERNELVNVLKTGSLPAPLHEETSSEVGPSLGRDSIEKTRLSFLIGIALVFIIMIGIYRWSGWISVFGVMFHIMMTLAVMAAFGATLTLPGIAAVVLSVGMAVDGNILIFERIRDELLLGKSVRGAVDLGYSRAFSAILDGQLTTAAAGWVLLQYGSGPIKGFAVMLLVGVFTTLVSNLWVSRILFDWYVSRKKGTLGTISI
ncbi:MAG: protein translocase subunit SecD [Deltaproteobacteria bacterium]|nr:protein translocase subunit SecD [Deltaproteobacteria bacterium]